MNVESGCFHSGGRQSFDWTRFVHRFGWFVFLLATTLGLVALFADFAEAVMRTTEIREDTGDPDAHHPDVAQPTVGLEGGMRFNKPINHLLELFTGPVAYTMSILGIMVCGVSLVFGGELSDITRKVFMLALVISVFGLGTKFQDEYFDFKSAVICCQLEFDVPAASVLPGHNP